MKVLVIQPKIGMGDMVIYLPYIHAIAKKFQTSVSILVKENSRAKDLLIDDDQIKEIINSQKFKNYVKDIDRIECKDPLYLIIQFSKFFWLREAAFMNFFNSQLFLIIQMVIICKVFY